MFVFRALKGNKNLFSHTHETIFLFGKPKTKAKAHWIPIDETKEYRIPHPTLNDWSAAEKQLQLPLLLQCTSIILISCAPNTHTAQSAYMFMVRLLSVRVVSNVGLAMTHINFISRKKTCSGNWRAATVKANIINSGRFKTSSVPVREYVQQKEAKLEEEGNCTFPYDFIPSFSKREALWFPSQCVQCVSIAPLYNPPFLALCLCSSCMWFIRNSCKFSACASDVNWLIQKKIWEIVAKR